MTIVRCGKQKDIPECCSVTARSAQDGAVAFVEGNYLATS